MSGRYRRLIVLTQYLANHPLDQVSLTELSQQLGVAKSTLSEDLVLVKDTLEHHNLGRVESQVGVQGGIRYVPDRNRTQHSLRQWSQALSDPVRMMSDGFLYMTDLLFNPRWIDPMGQLLAERFIHADIQFVATVETKGIPLALACARFLGVEVVLLRRDNRLSEGSALSINYLSGSSRRIQSMSLSRRAPVRGGRVLFVDDFMKAGGTARAAQDLLADFDATIQGVGVLVATVAPEQKLVEQYSSCLNWDEADPQSVKPSTWAWELCQRTSVPKEGIEHDGGIR